MIKFALIGYGYRAKFYLRIAKALPKDFEVVGVFVIDNQTKQEVMEKEGVFATKEKNDIVNLKPDFIVNASPKDLTHDISLDWIRLGLNVLQETPLAISYEQLEETWKNPWIKNNYQIAEQYILYPEIESLIAIVKSHIIGEVHDITISMMHDYHAYSVIRALFSNENLKDFKLTGKKYEEYVTRTRSRYETFTDGVLISTKRSHVIFEWKDKRAVYDFSSEQYRSPIRHQTIHIKGSRGEIFNNMVYFLNEKNEPTSLPIEIIENLGDIQQISFNNQILYQKQINLSTQDEIAIARLLYKMKDFVSSKKEIYPLRYALEDAYVSLLMNELSDSKYGTKISRKRGWNL